MDSGSSGVVFAANDRLSRLGDAALGNILSFLPATEAARTATLSRRWRHVFAAVHTLSFAEVEAPLKMGYAWWRRCSYCDNGDVRAPRFVAGVSAALHGRNPAADAATVPLRALRVTFDEFGFLGGHDATMAIDGWIAYAVRGAGEALEIDLRLNTEQICEQAYALASSKNGHVATKTLASGGRGHGRGRGRGRGHGHGRGHGDDVDVDMDMDVDEVEPYSGQEKYIVPRSLFTSCAALCTLRLAGCWINLPSAMALPLLHTLHLTKVAGTRGTIQRLVCACPSLADLTLEACGNLTELSIAGACLRRLALRCCHGLASVNVDSPELQAFEYRGDVPAESPSPQFLTMHSPRKISFCSLDFCGVERTTEVFGEVFGLLENFAGVSRLHLTSARLGSSFVSRDGVFPCFPRLRNLEITGMLSDYEEDVSVAIWTVSRVLEQTPRLHTLSLFFLPEPDQVKDPRQHHMERSVIEASHKLRYNPYACLMAPRDVEVPSCLRKTTKEISLVHYQGFIAQRALAKFLLCNAAVVDEVWWKVARGPLSIQTKLMEEIRGWVMNKSANMMFF